MVGVNSYMHQFRAVAIFATLFAAISVSGEKGCIFDFENVSDFDLNCNSLTNSWIMNDDAKDSPQKNVLILSPEKEGCLKSRNTIILNSTSPVTFRFYHDSAKDENKKLTLRLIPKDGSCPDEQCVWEVAKDSSYKPGEWVTAEHFFPLKSMKEYYVQLQVDKSKGKLLLDSMIFPKATGDSSNCRFDEGSLRDSNEVAFNEINLFDKFTGEKVNNSGGGGGEKKKNLSPSLGELSKNLMLTSASVLTLNNLLN